MHPKLKIHHDKNYENWIREKTCLVCQRPGVDCHHCYHSGGKRVRNSYLSVPLCREHHTMGADAYHVLEHKRFEDKHALCLDWEIINFLSEYIQDAIDEWFKKHQMELKEAASKYRIALEAKLALAVGTIQRAIDDEETGHWGPDITVKAYLEETLAKIREGE